MNETVSPSGGAPITELTVAVKVTGCPWVDGLGEDVSVVLVAATVVPVPLSETVCGLFDALSVNVRVPVSVSTAWGVYVMYTLQGFNHP
jgi:hypothetical protein